jgi:adenosylcobinamide-GDP ribazoletransferase
LEGGENLKKLLRSLDMAFAMYSRIPVPQVDWTADSMSYVFCFFPAVGIVCGLGFALLIFLCQMLGVSSFLSAALCTLFPIVVTGGIHLDGFCDTCDALGSHKPKEEKLHILKDSHVGAFALIGVVCYLLLFVALWAEVSVEPWNAVLVLALIPVLSRTLSGLCAVTLQNARGSGLLATFTHVAAVTRTRVVLVCWLLASAAGMLLADWRLGLGALVASGLMLAVYLRMAKREFGGITGDLEGWFLQLCELCALAGVVLVQKLSAL